MKANVSVIIVTALLMGGCSFAPKLDVATPELPDASTQTQKASVQIQAQWWKQFNDPTLDALIEEALRRNDDLRLAAIRVEQAASVLGLRDAERMPTFDGTASAYRQKTSGESMSPFRGFIYNSFGISASVGYEFDFWGKLANAREAALSELIATEAGRETVRITLESSVAQSYFALIALNRQIEITMERAKSFEEAYQYRLRQHRFGEIDPLSLEQARTLSAQAKLSLESLKETKTLGENALSILLGRDPKALVSGGFPFTSTLPEPLPIPEAIPSDLLERRPDIRSAEEMLRSANAQIGVAKAAYFPSISLTGRIGLESSELNQLMQNSAQVWGIGPSLNIPIFDFGRIQNRVKGTEAQKESAQTAYAKTVKSAFKEVSDTLRQIEASRSKIAAQQESADAYARMSHLSQTRYDAGYVDYLNVLEAKRGDLDAQVNLIALQSELLAHQITLYKALGGGWKGKE